MDNFTTNSNFDQYDIVHLGVSGGKDSTATLLWLVNESGIPHEKIRETFWDNGNEHQFTYNYVSMLSQNVFPVETIRPPLDFYALAHHKKRFPGAKTRFCTQELKIFPSQRYILALQKTGARVLLLTGVRAQESRDRAKLPAGNWDEYYACDIYRPLLHYTIDDVWRITRRYGLRRNALYDLGAVRVGCLPCIMSRKSEIRMIARLFPERIDLIRQAEVSFPDPRSFSSFYRRTMVPARFRSKSITTKNGETMTVPTIDDVVDWSKTARGGRQYSFDFDDGLLCSSKWGSCE
jgi:3'-phosphoadenosine 5'-phosphosulfate sulfotransferase (PAPS reductase)/FAD synthetase